MEPIEEIKEYFESYEVTLTELFQLDQFADYHGFTEDDATTLLCNLEDTEVMGAIAQGDYTTFDLDNEGQFNDGYDDDLYGIEGAWGKD